MHTNHNENDSSKQFRWNDFLPSTYTQQTDLFLPSASKEADSRGGSRQGHLVGLAQPQGQLHADRAELLCFQPLQSTRVSAKVMEGTESRKRDFFLLTW